jgi:hypothetical protein
MSLGGAGGWEDFRSDDESVAVLRQQISVVTEFGFLAAAFACQQRVWIGGGSMRLVLRCSPWKFTVGFPGSSGGVFFWSFR